MTTPPLSTVKQFCQKHEAFTEGGLRHQIFNERTNGLAEAGAIVRIGRKVLIHEERYFNWALQNSPLTADSANPACT